MIVKNEMIEIIKEIIEEMIEIKMIEMIEDMIEEKIGEMILHEDIEMIGGMIEIIKEMIEEMIEKIKKEGIQVVNTLVNTMKIKNQKNMIMIKEERKEMNLNLKKKKN